MTRSPFHRTELQKLKLVEMVRKNPDFRKCFEKNITDSFFNDLHERIEGTKPDHFILYLWGQTGTFKSSVAQSIAKRLYPHVTAQNIVFDNRSIVEVMPEIGNNNIVIRDESPKEFGMGTLRINTEVATYTETLRKSQVSLIFIRPILTDFPQAHYYLRTLEYREDMSQVRVGVQDPITGNYLGFILVDVSLHNDLWVEYEKKKDTFLEQVLSGKGKGLNLDEYAQKVFAHEDFDVSLKKKDVRLIVYKLFHGLTTSEISMIESEVFLKMRKMQK